MVAGLVSLLFLIEGLSWVHVYSGVIDFDVGGGHSAVNYFVNWLQSPPSSQQILYKTCREQKVLYPGILLHVASERPFDLGW